MPHVIVKMHSGRSEADKNRLAAEINAVLKNVLGSKDETVSVGIEDVSS